MMFVWIACLKQASGAHNLLRITASICVRKMRVLLAVFQRLKLQAVYDSGRTRKVSHCLLCGYILSCLLCRGFLLAGAQHVLKLNRVLIPILDSDYRPCSTYCLSLRLIVVAPLQTGVAFSCNTFVISFTYHCLCILATNIAFSGWWTCGHMWPVQPCSTATCI